jgi:hypothetical protein
MPVVVPLDASQSQRPGRHAATGALVFEGHVF